MRGGISVIIKGDRKASPVHVGWARARYLAKLP